MASVGEFPTGVDFLRTALKFGERKRDYYDKFWYCIMIDAVKLIILIFLSILSFMEFFFLF